MEQVKVVARSIEIRNDDDYLLFVDDDVHYIIPIMNRFSNIFGNHYRLLHFRQATQAWDCIMGNLVNNGKLPRLVITEAFVNNAPHEPVFFPGMLMKAYPEIPIILLTKFQVENISELNKRSHHFAGVFSKQTLTHNYSDLMDRLIHKLF